MKLARIRNLATALMMACLSAACSDADGLPRRSEVLKLLNADAPFDYFHTIFVCDVSSLGSGTPKPQVDWHFSRGYDAKLLNHCSGGDVSGLGANSNLNAETVSLFFDRTRLAQLQRLIGPLTTTTSFDGYDHHYIYASSAPLELGKTSNGFATVEKAEAPFVRLTLKSFRFRVGEVKGVREPSAFGPEAECTAVADYVLEVSEPSPWAQIFIDANPEYWLEVHSACLTRYDDGWRLTKWNLDT